MKISVVVQGSPYSQCCASALAYTEAALESGHEISRVFFHQDGVLVANHFSSPPQDEPDIGKMWSELAEKHELELVVCITSASRRGILDETESNRNGSKSYNLAANFIVGGLGLLMDAVLESDRAITFGG